MPFLYFSTTCSPRQLRIQGNCISFNHSPQSCSSWGKRIWAGPDAFTPSFQKSSPGGLISRLKEHPLSIKGNLHPQLGAANS